jgi:hypothetical protein
MNRPLSNRHGLTAIAPKEIRTFRIQINQDVKTVKL